MLPVAFEHVKTLSDHNELSKLCQHFRERGLPYGLLDSLYTLTSYIVRSYLLRNEINTRYGRVANPYPTGTFTPQDTPGFAQRDNETVEKLWPFVLVISRTKNRAPT